MAGKAGGFLALDWSDGSPTGPLTRRSFRLHEELAAKFDDKIGYRRVNTLSVKTSAAAKGGENPGCQIGSDLSSLRGRSELVFERQQTMMKKCHELWAMLTLN